MHSPPLERPLAGRPPSRHRRPVRRISKGGRRGGGPFEQACGPSPRAFQLVMRRAQNFHKTHPNFPRRNPFPATEPHLANVGPGNGRRAYKRKGQEHRARAGAAATWLLPSARSLQCDSPSPAMVVQGRLDQTSVVGHPGAPPPGDDSVGDRKLWVQRPPCHTQIGKGSESDPPNGECTAGGRRRGLPPGMAAQRRSLWMLGRWLSFIIDAIGGMPQRVAVPHGT